MPTFDNEVFNFIQMYRWLRTVETVGRQYAFIKFGEFLCFFLLPPNYILREMLFKSLWRNDKHLRLLNKLLTDRVIQRKRRDYLDPNSSTNMKKLNDDLQSIHSIMRKTIDDVLDR